MIEFVLINGTAIRVTHLTRREVEGAGGGRLREVTLVVIVRGEPAHQAILAVAAAGAVTLEIPDEDGPERFPVEVVSADHVVVGQGKATAYRHEVTLRERAPAPAGEGVATETWGSSAASSSDPGR